MRRKIIIFLTFMIFINFVSACTFRNSDISNGSRVKTENEEKITGGNCSYKYFKGIVTIKEVQPISGSNSANSNSPEKYKVSFVFEADAPDAPELVKKFENELWLTKHEIERNQIKAGKQISTEASYQVSGTCSPGPFFDQFRKSLSVENQ